MNQLISELFAQLQKNLQRVDFVGLLLDPEFQDGIQKVIAAVRRHIRPEEK